MIKLSLKYIATLWGYLNVKIIIGMPKCINVKKIRQLVTKVAYTGCKKSPKILSVATKYFMRDPICDVIKYWASSFAMRQIKWI